MTSTDPHLKMRWVEDGIRLQTNKYTLQTKLETNYLYFFLRLHGAFNDRTNTTETQRNEINKIKRPTLDVRLHQKAEVKEVSHKSLDKDGVFWFCFSI
jgi:hypothetical protein